MLGTRRFPRSLAWLAACALIAVLLAVAGSATRGSGGRVAREITPSEADLLYAAEQRLVVACMARQGFRYWPNERHRTTEYREFPYVVDDVDWARRNGYGRRLELEIDASVGTNPNERYVQSLPADRRAAALEALNGRTSDSRLSASLPSGGTVHRSSRSCTSAAQRELYGDLARWYEVTHVADNLVGLRHGLVHQDQRFTGAVSAWSHCMRRAGFPLDTPGQARDSLPPLAQAGSWQVEIRTATAEATCAKSSGLAAVARQLDQHYRQVLRGRHKSVFADRSRLQGAALPRARTLLSSP